nr:murein L,D-transpeptidase catalytic domain family protein [Bacteriovorax sp. HI3]
MKQLIVLFLAIFVSNSYASESLTPKNSREVWLSFNGTNYCKPGFCAEAIPYRALREALNFYRDNQDVIDNTSYVGIIDFTMQSTLKRFFILNLKTGAVESMLVTHGKKSETELGFAGQFSNTINSEMSSLGFYLTDNNSYIGKHGVSLRLDGLSETNSNARARNIVLHGADYATQWFADQKGRLGLSQGCPAVAPNKIEGVIKKLKGRGLLYIHKNKTI